MRFGGGFWRGIRAGESAELRLDGGDGDGGLAKALQLQGAGTVTGRGDECGYPGVSAVGRGLRAEMPVEGLLSQALMEERLRAAIEGGRVSFGTAELALVGFDADDSSADGTGGGGSGSGGTVQELALRVRGEGRFLVAAGMSMRNWRRRRGGCAGSSRKSPGHG